MKWPWSAKPTVRAPDPNRGTLALLPYDEIVLGVPSGASSSLAAYAREMLAAWRDDDRRPRKPIVFPFPVDVTDLR